VISLAGGVKPLTCEILAAWQEQTLVSEFGHIQGSLPREAMIWSHQSNGTDRKEQSAAQPLVSRKRDREVQFAPLQLRPQATGAVFGQAHVDLWVASLMVSQERREEAFKRQGRYPNAYDPHVSAA
jgi:hypothetical protein